jgi:acyl dehydratase
MFSMGLTARMLTDWLGPASLKKYGVRFTRQVWPGDTLTAKAEVTDVSNGVATIRVWTENQAGEAVVEGEAQAAVE